MNEPAFGWSVVISGIALVVSVLSPVLTTILTNWHQDKMWARNNYFIHKSDVIEQYVKSTGIALKQQTVDTLETYGSSYGAVFFYAPTEAWPLIEQIDNAILSRGVTDETSKVFAELCKILSTEGKRPKK